MDILEINSKDTSATMTNSLNIKLSKKRVQRSLQTASNKILTPIKQSTTTIIKTPTDPNLSASQLKNDISAKAQTQAMEVTSNSVSALIDRHRDSSIGDYLNRKIGKISMSRRRTVSGNRHQNQADGENQAKHSARDSTRNIETVPTLYKTVSTNLQNTAENLVQAQKFVSENSEAIGVISKGITQLGYCEIDLIADLEEKTLRPLKECLKDKAASAKESRKIRNNLAKDYFKIQRQVEAADLVEGESKEINIVETRQTEPDPASTIDPRANKFCGAIGLIRNNSSGSRESSNYHTDNSLPSSTRSDGNHRVDSGSGTTNTSSHSSEESSNISSTLNGTNLRTNNGQHFLLLKETELREAEQLADDRNINLIQDETISNSLQNFIDSKVNYHKKCLFQLIEMQKVLNQGLDSSVLRSSIGNRGQNPLVNCRVDQSLDVIDQSIRESLCPRDARMEASIFSRGNNYMATRTAHANYENTTGRTYSPIPERDIIQGHIAESFRSEDPIESRTELCTHSDPDGYINVDLNMSSNHSINSMTFSDSIFDSIDHLKGVSQRRESNEERSLMEEITTDFDYL